MEKRQIGSSGKYRVDMSVQTPTWILCAANEEESLATQVLDRSKQRKQFFWGEGGLFNVKC